MFRLGVTGGIGAGKSLVCGILSRMGVPVYDSDSAARNLMKSDVGLRKGIIDLLGEGAYEKEQLNRSYIAGKIFQSPPMREGLNALVHPVVGRDFELWTHAQEGVPYVVKEAAILFESGAWKQVDMSLLVTAPEDLRIRRIMERDGSTEEAVRSRLASQMKEEDALQRADVHIRNDEKQMLLPQVVELHNKILRKV